MKKYIFMTLTVVLFGLTACTEDAFDRINKDNEHPSPEAVPAALQLTDNVSLKEKEDRLHELNELINKYSKESNLKMLNKSVKVLITGVSEKDDTKVCGYTENMKLVNVDAPKEDIGKIINVKITEAKSFSLDGIKES